MIEDKMSEEEMEQAKERYELSIERIQRMLTEETVKEPYRSYFRKTAGFILEMDRVGQIREDGTWAQMTEEQRRAENQKLYDDILPGNYETSYANPEYAVKTLGETFGAVLSFLYTEMRSEIAYVFERKILYLAICNELFIEVYNIFEDEEEPEYKEVRNVIYWYASDYCDVFVADRIMEQIDPDNSFAADIIMNADLDDTKYLYEFGEYITENELRTARHLAELGEETIQRMADVYTEGYRIGFVNTGKDLSKKSTVNIRYTLGFEKVVKKAIENFEKMGLRPTIYRAAVCVLNKRLIHKIGYYGAAANKQFDYDHRMDQALFLDKRFVERKLDVTKNVYEKQKDLAGKFAGPACIDVFGEKPFIPVRKPEALVLNEKQEQLSSLYDSKSGQLVNQYIKGEERSFTIVAYPIPEIGDQYEEIFDEIIRINTLDADLYQKVQQTIIDALDEGKCVHIEGGNGNSTDLTVQLYRLNDPEKETIFENCVADVNIPVGEVFTSPVLEGTDGVLNVSKVYLGELQYKDLTIEFKDGMITDYDCSNFEDPAEGKKYIYENILQNHEALPLGEFAIGTNTTAYAVAKKYGIEEKLPILIAEKMGPHFAVGDTCYSWSEDIKVYNPNGKEIVARDNSVSLLRKEDPGKAYFQCHTDITIPYEELKAITVIGEDGKKTEIIRDGKFVLEGTEVLNEPLKEME